ncbi:MAG: hypothetical protein E6J40_11960 [Chloroflexi bacterium]|nr:MAG: hypothetical protein E6J40_11960 [Chloroflexota bacterium]
MNTMGGVTGVEAWPELPYGEWYETLETLHMVTQIVGKVRLSLTPFEPQWANVPLYTTARGMTTTPMASDGVIFQVDIDLIDHQVLISTAGGETRRVALKARPVAAFYAEFMSNLSAIGIAPRFQPLRRTTFTRHMSRNGRIVSSRSCRGQTWS